MKRISTVVVACVVAVASIAGAQVPELINYQGRLVDGTNLVNGTRTVVFRLYAVPTGGTALYQETQTVAVVDGLYAAHIGASNAAPNGLHNALGANPCYLEVEIEGQVLAPRERLASVAYAHYAAAAEDGAIAETMLADDAVTAEKIASGAVGEDELAADSVSTDKLADDAVTAGKIADGSISNADLAAGAVDSRAIADRSISNVDVAVNTFWQTVGNAGTIAGTHFIGTTDMQPLEFRVRSNRALRLETDGTVAMNVVGGSSHNVVSNNVIGATVFGGGASNSWAPPNIVGRAYGTACGGADNKVVGSFSAIAGGFGNTADGYASAIGGGTLNRTISDNGTVAGGELNQAGWLASVGGGQNNTAAQYGVVSGGGQNYAFNFSAVPGGFGNVAEGAYSVAAGGYSNTALRNFTFAAGRGAKANHVGTFVWADSTNADFESTADNQFLIRAGGGVGINTNVTPATLTVAGNIHSYGFRVEQTTNAPNIVAGHPSNACAPGVVGSVIAGGGYVIGVSGAIAANRIEHYASAIGGGYYNGIYAEGGGGWGGADVVAGGWSNTIRDSQGGAVIGGGLGNEIWHGGRAAVIAGGEQNEVSNAAWYAAIGGGYVNRAEGKAATVPGGQQNAAVGDYSLACGFLAEALHNGSFVWNDSRGWPPFSSTTNNQFLIQAGGGVGIGTNVTPEQLTVAGNVKANTFIGSGAGLTVISGTSLVANTVGATQLADGASLAEILDDDGPGSGLDADLLDGYHASNASNAVPINNGVLNANLNADMLDGIHAASFPRIYASGVVQNGSTNITIPHYRTFTLELASGHPYGGGVAHLTGCENDNKVGIVYTKFNGEGWGSGYGGTNSSLWSTNVLLFFGNTAYTNEVKCPGDGSRALVLRHAGTAEMLYKLIY